MHAYRINQYRIMWVFVFFDLPTETKTDRKNAALFRQRLLKDGFRMFQFSIYLRHCPSRENAAVHIKRVQKGLPPDGYVGVIEITDKQFGDMQLYYGKKAKPLPVSPQQLSLF